MWYTIFVLYCSRKSHAVLWSWPWLPVTSSPFISSWPGLHSGLHLDKQLHYENNISSHMRNVATRSSLRHAPLLIRRCVVFASPVAPDCLHCWTALTIIANHSLPHPNLHNSMLHNIQVKYISVFLFIVWYDLTGPEFSCLNCCGMVYVYGVCIVCANRTKV